MSITIDPTQRPRVNFSLVRASTHEVFAEHNTAIGGDLRVGYGENAGTWRVNVYVFKDNKQQGKFSTPYIKGDPFAEESKFRIREVVRQAIAAKG